VPPDENDFSEKFFKILEISASEPYIIGHPQADCPIGFPLRGTIQHITHPGAE